MPLQPPEAVQEVALVLLHCKVVCPPDDTLVGLALKLNVGAGVGAAVTVTEADWLTDPPLPVQANAKVVLALSGPTL